MTEAFARIVVAYLVAGAVAFSVGVAAGFEHPIAVAAAADLAATVVIFWFSVAHRNSSFYDAYWSVVPPVIALYWCARPEVFVDPLRRGLVLGLVAVWGARLTWNWARGWQGLSHEDWRYVDLQRRTGRAYWLVSFFGIHLMPTLWVFAGCLPIYVAVSAGARPLNWIDALAALATGAAIWIEARADAQLRSFRAAGPAPEEILTTGLWKNSRHPNYFGEMLFWWGLYGFALAADPGWWWTGVGALSITIMFVGVSLPMIEGRMLERRPGFAEHQRRTRRVLPWPPRKEAS